MNRLTNGLAAITFNHVAAPIRFLRILQSRIARRGGWVRKPGGRDFLLARA